MKNKKTGVRCRQALLLLVTAWVTVSLFGCEAFVRKFTRKQKKEEGKREEMVLVPQEYLGPDLTKEELYRQQFLFWEAWHDELIETLTGSANHKKQVGCAEQAIKNLEQVRARLDEPTRKKLDVYLDKLRGLKDAIVKDGYSNNASSRRGSAERIKRDILKNFSYQKIKDYLL